jgi:CHAP domain
VAGAGGLAVHALTGANRASDGAKARADGPYMALETATGSTVLVPNTSTLPALRARVVGIAESQIGYQTDPAGTYCNKYSAFWESGADRCGNDNLSEEWCADFAAWVWRKAGVPLVYQYVNGDINSSAASFYEWGQANGTWHALGSGYTPEPGDVAVYGLDPATLYASHVAIVVGYSHGQNGPVAVNGDGDVTGFSAVEVRANEYLADTHPSGAPLSGYVSPD